MNHSCKLPESKIVTSVHLPEVHNLLTSMSFADQIYNRFASPESARKEYSETIETLTDWLSSALSPLDAFNHSYTTAGITEALQCWIQEETRDIYMLDGDYSWLKFISDKVKVVNHWSMVPEAAVLYITNPSAIDGNFMKDWEQIMQSRIPVVLDCAYLGTTPPHKIHIGKNVEVVFYSLSKNFCLSKMRIGWIFSKKAIKGLEKLKEYNYFPAINIIVIQKIMSRFSYDKMYQDLAETHEKICRQLELRRSDSVLLGFDEGDKFVKFRRGNTKICRVPLGSYF